MPEYLSGGYSGSIYFDPSTVTQVSRALKTVFFYGLFMDADLLAEKGLQPRNVETACLPGYGLRIGARASLERSESERAYGTVMQLRAEELASLYAGDGVEDYVPRDVRVTLPSRQTVEALCYLLPMDRLSGRNSAYATKLAAAARKLELPQGYVSEIETWI